MYNIPVDKIKEVIITLLKYGDLALEFDKCIEAARVLRFFTDLFTNSLLIAGLLSIIGNLSTVGVIAVHEF